jgi:predicted glycoside hydrolase/deacetylase ChbG (UPF0249 family)
MHHVYLFPEIKQWTRNLAEHFTASVRSSIRNHWNFGWNLVSPPQYSCTYGALNQQPPHKKQNFSDSTAILQP